MTLFVPIVHERAPSHGIPELVPETGQRPFSSCSSGMLGEAGWEPTFAWLLNFTVARPSPAPAPVTPPQIPLKLLKKSRNPHAAGAKSWIRAHPYGRMFHNHVAAIPLYTTKSCLPFRFAVSAASLFLSAVAPSLSSSLYLSFFVCSVYFIYTFPDSQ